ncbi:hypothetical protein FSP39_014913 [Pinctada imbricata]|uniref:G-protein coupled receptors family 1 profile domain-containing protein n=1 Tax=Pinctada imbricata TaxID=66713 RepID=A0AA88XZ21_PINIB|nr:hypothetical protein FSP39_014913 [Pinctada imbricata]
MSYVTTTNGSVNQGILQNSSNEVIKSPHGNQELLPFHITIIFILLYTLTTFLAIVGNITTIFVLAKGKRSKTDLRPFLLNLAIADLIMAIFCIPFTFSSELLKNWMFSEPMCPIVVFLQAVSVTASVSTNMAVGIDRFYAITYPLKARITSSKYKIVITVIWIFAISLSAVQLKVCRVEVMVDPADNQSYVKMCSEVWEDPIKNGREIYTLLILFLTYIIPLTILTITYSIVGCILWRRTAPGNSDAVRDQMQLKAKLKVVKMLVTIVLLFGLCWLPLHIFFLVYDFSSIKDLVKNDPHLTYVLNIVYFVVHWLAMSNSFVNPVIYGLMNDNFRADLRTLIFQLCPCACKSTRSRHRVVKKKSRNSCLRDDRLLMCDPDLSNNHLHVQLLDRNKSRSQYSRSNSRTTETTLIASPSCKSF